MVDYIQLIRHAQQIPGITVFVVNVTPQIASELLKLNLHNRKIRHRVVDKYLSEINNDEWVLSAQGVGIDFNGVLCDGQHRLMAIIESQKSIPLIIVAGLAPVSQEKVDRQAKRSLYDVLHLAGYSENSTEVQIATLIATINNGMNYSVSDSEIKNTLMCHKEAISIVSRKRSHQRGLGRTGFLTACVFYYEMYNDKALLFMEKVQSGELLTMDDPAMRLRRFLLGELQIKYTSHGGTARMIDFKKTIYAINADILNKKITALKDSDSIISNNH